MTKGLGFYLHIQKPRFIHTLTALFFLAEHLPNSLCFEKKKKKSTQPTIVPSPTTTAAAAVVATATPPPKDIYIQQQQQQQQHHHLRITNVFYARTD